jgi:hypothetical protein
MSIRLTIAKPKAGIFASSARSVGSQTSQRDASHLCAMTYDIISPGFNRLPHLRGRQASGGDGFRRSGQTRSSESVRLHSAPIQGRPENAPIWPFRLTDTRSRHCASLSISPSPTPSPRLASFGFPLKAYPPSPGLRWTGSRQKGQAWLPRKKLP